MWKTSLVIRHVKKRSDGSSLEPEFVLMTRVPLAQTLIKFVVPSYVLVVWSVTDSVRETSEGDDS